MVPYRCVRLWSQLNDPTRLTCMYSAQGLMSSAFIEKCYDSNVAQHVAVCSWQFCTAKKEHFDPNGPQNSSVAMHAIFNYQLDDQNQSKPANPGPWSEVPTIVPLQITPSFLKAFHLPVTSLLEVFICKSLPHTIPALIVLDQTSPVQYL